MCNISWQAFNMRTALMAASLKCATSAGKHKFNNAPSFDGSIMRNISWQVFVMRTALMEALTLYMYVQNQCLTKYYMYNNNF